jgi:hypothetical protein
MNNTLIPSDDEFVESIAKSIARNRIQSEASSAMSEMIGIKLEESVVLESTFDRVFEQLWSLSGEYDNRQKDLYRGDARAAIAAINLKLLTSV